MPDTSRPPVDLLFFHLGGPGRPEPVEVFLVAQQVERRLAAAP